MRFFLFGHRVKIDSQTILIISTLIVSSLVTKSKEKINFLDVIIKIKEGRVTADRYCKSMDGHQYFHYNSYYADHAKRSIIFSKTLQLKRICSEKNNLNVQIEALKKWLKTGTS